MSDTVKIERPMCCRRHEDLGGRVKEDSLGNAIKVRTRVHDAQDANPANYELEYTQIPLPRSS
jgi:hypothetical protein